MKSKKIIKKLLMMSTTIILGTSLLTGCNSNNTDETKVSDNANQTTIKFAMWDNIDEENNFIKAFEEKNQDIKVDLMVIPSDNYSEKLNSMIAGKSAPDVILAWECDINRFAKNGAIEKLDDYLESSNIDTNDFIPAVSDLTKITEGSYGLPWCYASEILYYNKDMFDAAGVEYPNDTWTWEDFREAAKKLTIKDGSNVTQWGATTIDIPGVWYSQIGQTGDKVVDAEGNIILGDGAKKALQFEYELINEDKVVPEPSGATGNAVDLFTAGKAAMTRTGSWFIGSYKEIKDFNWDISVLPKGDIQYASLHTGFFTVSSDSKYKEAAWRFIEYCMSEEGQEMISKSTSNPSAIKSFTAKGAYKNGGENGPTNWDAIEETAEFGKFGYVLAAPGVTNKLVDKFNAVVAGQVDVDTALKDGQKEIDSAK